MWLDDELALPGRGGSLVIGCAERPPGRAPSRAGATRIWSLGAIVPAYDAAPPEVRSSIERAIDGRGVTDVAICGHLGCVALKALLTGAEHVPEPRAAAWIAHADRVRRIVTGRYLDRPADALFELALQHHVLAQLEQLLTHPAVARAAEAGRLKLHGWIVDPRSGSRWTYDPAEQQFSLVRTGCELVERREEAV